MDLKVAHDIQHMPHTIGLQQYIICCISYATYNNLHIICHIHIQCYATYQYATLHSCDMWHIQCATYHMPHPICYIIYATSNMLHIICHMLHITCHIIAIHPCQYQHTKQVIEVDNESSVDN